MGSGRFVIFPIKEKDSFWDLFHPKLLYFFLSSVIFYIFAIQPWTANKAQNKEWLLKILLKNPLAL